MAVAEVDIAMYWFTNQELFDKLCSLLRTGKKVSLIIYNDYLNNSNFGLDFQHFIDLGGVLYLSKFDEPVHNKFCIIDKKIVINGSYNWTYYAEQKNKENITVIEYDDTVINCFQEEFDALTRTLTRSIKYEPFMFHQYANFNAFGGQTYWATEMLSKAKHTNQPAIANTILSLVNHDVKVEEIATKLKLLKGATLKQAIGLSVINDGFVKLFNASQLVPATAAQTLKTTARQQRSMATTISYGSNELASKNVMLGEIKMSGLPPLDEGLARIELTCSINLNGILSINTKCLNTGLQNPTKSFNIHFLLSQPL